MHGISSKAAGGILNKKKFNDGTELENSVFNDGSGLDLYSTDFRSYDPQIGRFHQIDELAEYDLDWSPFVFARNYPILLNDPLGLFSDTTARPHPDAPDAKTKLAETVTSEEVFVTTKKTTIPGIPMQNTTPTLELVKSTGNPSKNDNNSAMILAVLTLPSRFNPVVVAGSAAVGAGLLLT